MKKFILIAITMFAFIGTSNAQNTMDGESIKGDSGLDFYAAAGLSIGNSGNSTFAATSYPSLEFGFKSTLSDGKLILNGAYYNMDWTDYQTSTFNTDITAVAYTENVGNAEIKGLELNAVYSPNDTTSLTFYLNKMDPRLSDDYYYVSGELGANAGNKLANMPKLSYYFAAEKDKDAA